MKFKLPKSVAIRAAIISGIFVLIAAILTPILSVIISARNSNDDINQIIDNIEIVSIKPIESLITTIIPTKTVIREKKISETGILTVYFEILVANNGTETFSITDYNLIQVNQNYIAVDYSGMNQGLYNRNQTNLIPIDFPIIIAAGESKPILLKVGIIMGEESYKIVIKKFDNQKSVTLNELNNFLRIQGFDFYDNYFTEEVEGVFSLPELSLLNEQIFNLEFVTARNNAKQCYVSWYKFGSFSEYIENVD